MYKVSETKNARKGVCKLPNKVRKKYELLLNDLRLNGPVLKSWKNFSSLGGNKYHCHLSYHWIACWEWHKDKILIEVYYAGSRENAPY